MKANQTVCTGLDSLIESSQIPGLQVAVVTAERTVFEQLRAHSLILSDSARMQFYTRQQTNAGVAVPTTLGWHVGMLNGASLFTQGSHHAYSANDPATCRRSHPGQGAA